jgi:hypothetical protein
MGDGDQRRRAGPQPVHHSNDKALTARGNVPGTTPLGDGRQPAPVPLPPGGAALPGFSSASCAIRGAGDTRVPRLGDAPVLDRGVRPPAWLPASTGDTAPPWAPPRPAHAAPMDQRPPGTGM